MPSDPRQEAIEALAEALQPDVFAEMVAGDVLDYLDAHPEAKAALAAWLDETRDGSSEEPPPWDGHPLTDEQIAYYTSNASRYRALVNARATQPATVVAEAGEPRRSPGVPAGEPDPYPATLPAATETPDTTGAKHAGLRCDCTSWEEHEARPPTTSPGDRSDNEPRTAVEAVLSDEGWLGALPQKWRQDRAYIDRVLNMVVEAATPPSPAAGGLREAFERLVDAVAAYVPHLRLNATLTNQPDDPVSVAQLEFLNAMHHARAALASGASSETAGLRITEADLADLVRGPYLHSLMEDFNAGRTDAEHVARWLMGDLRALVAATPVAGSASEEAGQD